MSTKLDWITQELDNLRRSLGFEVFDTAALVANGTAKVARIEVMQAVIVCDNYLGSGRHLAIMAAEALDTKFRTLADCLSGYSQRRHD